MKKRVKLFTTIASLCLAVALMAFGVFAATKVTIGVTNTVSFTATANVKAKIWHTTAVTNCTADDPLADTSEASPDYTITGNETGDTDTPYEQTIAIGDVDLTATSGDPQNMTFSYTIYIKNTIDANSSYPNLRVVVTPVSSDNFASNRYSIATTYGTQASTATTVLTTGQQMSYTVTITVDNAHTIADINLGTSFVLTAEVASA